MDFARKRLQLGESLYYKTLEGIIQGEKRRLGGEQKEANLLVSFLVGLKIKSFDFFPLYIFFTCSNINLSCCNYLQLFGF